MSIISLVMVGDLSEMMRNITVNEAEDEVVGYEGESRNGGIGRVVRTMLGRVHTDRPYSFQRMNKALSAAWRPRRSVTFNELDSNSFWYILITM